MIDVLYWDPDDVGHHRRYLRAVVETAPKDVRIIVPSWFDPAEWTPEVSRSVDQSLADEYRNLKRVMDATTPDVVVLASGHQMSRRISLDVQPPDVGVVVVDLRGVPAGLHSRHRASIADLPKAAVDTILREMAVRRSRIAYLALIPEAVGGSKRLRAASSHYRDPLEALDAPPSSSTSRPRRRIVLPGVLKHRKGVTDLAKAVAGLPESVQRTVEVVYAGQPTEGGIEGLQVAEQILETTEASVRVVPRRLDRDELAALIDTADVVALPYRSHKGGSGFLGTVLTSTCAQVVISDFGHPGSIGAHVDAVTFQNEDVGSLTLGLAEALERGRRNHPTAADRLAGFYGSDATFGAQIWSAVHAVSHHPEAS